MEAWRQSPLPGVRQPPQLTPGTRARGRTGSFALGHRGKVIDFAYRAVHEMTVKAKLIVAASCLRPGANALLLEWLLHGRRRQGVVEAQRFAE